MPFRGRAALANLIRKTYGEGMETFPALFLPPARLAHSACFGVCDPSLGSVSEFGPISEGILGHRFPNQSLVKIEKSLVFA